MCTIMRHTGYNLLQCVNNETHWLQPAAASHSDLGFPGVHSFFLPSFRTTLQSTDYQSKPLQDSGFCTFGCCAETCKSLVANNSQHRKTVLAERMKYPHKTTALRTATIQKTVIQKTAIQKTAKATLYLQRTAF